MYNIPLSEPGFNGNEWEYVKDCIDQEWVSSAGKYVNLFENRISEFTGSKYSVACVNGTAALQVSLRLIGVESNDEVIIPSLTFIAPVNAIFYNNAKPIFMDSDDYYNIDIEKTIQFIKNETIYRNGSTFNKRTNKKISAIIFVHVWGNACLFDDIVELCKDRNIIIVEDASESLGTFYKDKNRHTGLVGDIGCISFNGNKIITTGGGGMIITDNQNLAAQAKYLTTQAKDDSLHYVHNQVGYNYRLTNIQAALGVAQLEQISTILENKKNIHRYYYNEINKIDGLSLAKVPDYAENNHWLNILQIEDSYPLRNQLLLEKLNKKGIFVRPVWKPNHLQNPYKNCQSYKIENTLNLVKKSLCLPSSSKLYTKELDIIISHLK